MARSELRRRAVRPFAALETLGRLALRTERAGPPLQLYLVLNEVCDLRCRMCGFWQGIYEEPGRETLRTSELRELMRRCADAGTRSVVLTGGEPFLRLDLLELVETAADLFPFARLQTNGMHLGDDAVDGLLRSGLDVLWVSVDGPAEVHDAVRGRDGAFATVREGLLRLRAARPPGRPPSLILNATVLPENVDRLAELVDLAEEVGAASLQLHAASDLGRDPIERSEALLGVTGAATLQFSRKRREGGRGPGPLPASVRDRIEWARRAGRVRVDVDPVLDAPGALRPAAGCTWPWGVFMVGPYGDLLACQSLDRWKMADLRTTGVAAAWNGAPYRRLRARVREGLPVCEQCCVPFRSLGDHLVRREQLERFVAGRGVRARRPSGSS